MKTKRAYGVTVGFTLFLIAACGGSQGDTLFNDAGFVESADGGGGGVVIIDSGSRSSFPIPDTGTTFVDTGAASSGTGTSTGTTGTGTGGGGVCPSSCTTDSECQASCPASPGAINCCDAVTMACFTSAASQCPDLTGSSSGSGGTNPSSP